MRSHGTLFRRERKERLMLSLLPAGNVKKASKAKVAVFSCGLDIAQTETKGTVLLKKAEELLDFSRGEEKQLEGVSLVVLVIGLSR